MEGMIFFFMIVVIYFFPYDARLISIYSTTKLQIVSSGLAYLKKLFGVFSRGNEDTVMV